MTIHANSMSLYSVGYHFLFYSLISVHACLLTDLTPLQKKPFCDLNFLLATVIAAFIPSAMTNLVVFDTFLQEVSFGSGLAVTSSIIITTTIQHFFDVDIYF